MPRPWTTRQAMRNGTVCDMPAAADPITKTTMESCTSSFLLNRSESLPQIGVLTVVASSEAVMTQVYWRWVPCRSPMIVGSAVETMVELSSAVNSAAMRPVIASRIWRCDISAWGGAPRGGVTLRGSATVVLISGPSRR